MDENDNKSKKLDMPDKKSELKYFPNKKTQLNQDQFFDLFRKGVIKNENQEDMLLKSFQVFDFDK